MNNIGLDQVITQMADLLDELKEESIYENEEFESTVIFKFKNEKMKSKAHRILQLPKGV